MSKEERFTSEIQPWTNRVANKLHPTMVEQMRAMIDEISELRNALETADIQPSNGVQVCPHHDAACAEIPPGLRCVDCKVTVPSAKVGSTK